MSVEDDETLAIAGWIRTRIAADVERATKIGESRINELTALYRDREQIIRELQAELANFSDIMNEPWNRDREIRIESSRQWGPWAMQTTR